ncbi:hypothetical protein PHMEG_0009891 [Phytophthora megakarya]|uniref:Uncharacterized protein n=1 Tax=Phytophthora megakarya TaxID=4795 RepID=A0A225WFZ3_9STRA|nr:hypothetical protein PHMEG_0009891 [Phytophthora megakarya]
MLKAGQDPEHGTISVLKATNKNPKAYGTVVKTLKQMHTMGKNSTILLYRVKFAVMMVISSKSVLQM